jgi:hypothetical protein
MGARGGSTNRLMQPSTPGVNVMEEKIKLSQKHAIMLFNQNKFDESLVYFEDVLRMLQMMYPANHPECVKAEKSILLVQRKMGQNVHG